MLPNGKTKLNIICASNKICIFIINVITIYFRMHVSKQPNFIAVAQNKYVIYDERYWRHLKTVLHLNKLCITILMMMNVYKTTQNKLFQFEFTLFVLRAPLDVCQSNICCTFQRFLCSLVFTQSFVKQPLCECLNRLPFSVDFNCVFKEVLRIVMLYLWIYDHYYLLYFILWNEHLWLCYYINDNKFKLNF